MNDHLRELYGGLAGMAVAGLTMEALSEDRSRAEMVFVERSRDGGGRSWRVHVSYGDEARERFRLASKDDAVEAARRLGIDLGVPAYDEGGRRIGANPRGAPGGWF